MFIYSRYYELSDIPHRSSSDLPTPAPIAVWLVTHLSVDRIDKLRSLCLQWRGSIAASIWVQPTLSSYDRKTAYRDIQRLVDDTIKDKKLFSCDLRVVRAENMFTGSFAEKFSSFLPFPGLKSSLSVLSADLYPVNALRGAALDIVVECVSGTSNYKSYSEHSKYSNCNAKNADGNVSGADTLECISNTAVFVIDVDMRPPDLLCLALSNLDPQNNMLAIIRQQCVDDGKFLVIPALELCRPDESCEGDADDDISSIDTLLRSKDYTQLTKLLSNLKSTRRIRAFHSSSYNRGHCATLTERWLAGVAAPSVYDVNNRDIPVVPLNYREGWEPYGLIGLGLLMRVGGFNRSFVGWHRDKIEFIRRLSAHNVGFAICEDARGFILDWQPHAPTESRRQTEKG